MKWLICLAVMFGCVGCATQKPIPFNTVSLVGAPTVVSDKTAHLVHFSGAVAGSDVSTLIPMGKVFVPLSSGTAPELQFDVKSQSEFMDVLRSELLRFKVFRSVSVGTIQSKPDIRIALRFVKTYHYVQRQEYTLDVVMNLDGGKSPAIKQYLVNSNEKATPTERWNTNAYEARILAVRRLLERIVPDIQAYVAEAT